MLESYVCEFAVDGSLDVVTLKTSQACSTDRSHTLGGGHRAGNRPKS